MDVPKELWESFLRMSVEEKAILLVSAEKSARGEMGEDGSVTVSAEEFSNMIGKIKGHT